MPGKRAKNKVETWGNVIWYLVDVIRLNVATYPIYYSISSLNFAIYINITGSTWCVIRNLP